MEPSRSAPPHPPLPGPSLPPDELQQGGGREPPGRSGASTSSSCSSPHTDVGDQQQDPGLAGHPAIRRLPPDLLVREVFGRCSLTLRAVVLQRVCREWKGLLQGEVAGVQRQMHPFPFEPDLPPDELEGRTDNILKALLVAERGSLAQLAWLHQRGRLVRPGTERGSLRFDLACRDLMYLCIPRGDVARAQWLWDQGYDKGISAHAAASMFAQAPNNAMREWLWVHGVREHAPGTPTCLLPRDTARGDVAGMQWLFDHSGELRVDLWLVAVREPADDVGCRLAALEWLQQRGCPSWEGDPATSANV